MKHLSSVALWLYALSISSNGATAQQTVYEVIANNSDLSLFANALAVVSYDDPESSILTDNTQILTVFAPNNNAVADDALLQHYTDHPGWGIHLEDLFALHIVEGSALPLPSIFDFIGETDALETLGGSVELSTQDNSNTVAGQQVVEGGISATNGIIHVVDGVFQNVWRGVTLSNKSASFTPLFHEIVRSTGFESELEKLTPFGTTLVAASDDVFNNEEGGALLEAFLDESARDETYDTLLYNVIDENIYLQDIFPGIQYLVTPRSEKAQMWVTMNEDEQLRFNDAVVDVEGADMAENGVFFVADKLLTPPGIIEFLGITGFYSNLNTINAYEFFTSTSWNVSDLAVSLGYEPDTKFTMFAPVDSVLSDFSLEEVERLASPVWQLHLEDLVKTWLIEGTYTHDDLKSQVTASPDGILKLTMLSGASISVVADGVSGALFVDSGNLFETSDLRDIDLAIDGGSFYQPANMRGVDGLIQVIGTVLLPPSFQQTVYERVTTESELSLFTSLVDAASMGSIIDGFSPVTVFAVTNTAWRTFNSGESRNETAGLVENHIFEGLLSSDMLQDMDGQLIKSMNDKEFLVTVADDTIVLRGVGLYAETTKATVLKADILGSTGVLHIVDGVLHDFPLPEALIEPTSPPNDVEDVAILAVSSIAPSDTVTEFPTTVEEGTSTPSDEKSMETAAPSSVSSESESMEFTMMDEMYISLSNDTTNLLDDAEETLAPSIASNATNATFAPPVGEEDEDLGAITMPPELWDLIDVEADTDAPTAAPPTVTASPTTFSDNGEQIAVGSTSSDAQPQKCPSQLATGLVGVVTLSLMVWQQGFFS